MSSRGKRAALVVFLVASLGCLGCDQLTKEIARSHLAAGAAASLAFGTIELALVENPGAFLSLGAALPEAVRFAVYQVAVPIVLLILCITFLRQPGLTTVDATGLALVVGGGAGNWLDRLLRDGLVTDFVRVGVGPIHTGIFNAADVAILIGVAVLVVGTRRTSAASAG